MRSVGEVLGDLIQSDLTDAQRGLILELAAIATTAAADLKKTSKSARNAREYQARKARRTPETRLNQAPETRLKTPEFRRVSGASRVRDNLLDLEITGKKETEAKASLPGKRKIKARCCPPEWTPSSETLEVALKEGLNADDRERELTKMRDYEFRDAHSDWDKTARNWFRRVGEEKRRRSQPDKLTAHQRYVRSNIQ